MSVENKIREFLKAGTISEAFPGMGKNKEESPMPQGSSEKPNVQVLDKGAGADAAKKAGSATTLAAGSGPSDKSAPAQGSSNANPEKEDLGTDAPGKAASAKAKKTSLPAGKGAGQAHGTTPSVDPATVVAQKNSKGNVQREEAEVVEAEEDFITEEEFNALSDEEKAEYELVELSLKTMTKAYKERTKNETDWNSRGGSDDETLRDSHPKSTRTGEHILKKYGSKGKAAIKRADKNMGIDHMSVHKPDSTYKEINKHYENFDFSNDIKSLFEGDETLSEEFKTKAASIFEAVVLARVADIRSQIEENASLAAAEVIEEQVAQISEKVDAYLNYVVEQWLEQNQVAVESGLRTEMTEQFINGLRNLFAENFIEVPEERYDVIGEMQEQIEVLEAALNKQLEESSTLSAEVAELKRSTVLSDVTEGLAQTEIEKFKSLVEDISFEDEATYAEKLKVVKENYFPKTSKVQNIVESDDAGTAIETEVDSTVLKYAKAISTNAKFTK